MYLSGYCFVLYVLLCVAQFSPSTCTTCTTNPADVIFLLDGSGSVGTGNFATTLEFVNKIVDGFQIGTLSTQVSVAVFTHDTFDFKFNLNTYSTKQPLQAHITSIPFPSGGEDISEALEQARHKFLDPTFGSRPSAAGIVVLMTDGQSPSIQPSIASSQKLKDMGVTIYTAGVGGGANENELRGIASKHSYYFSCSDFNSLNTLSGPITSAACTDIADWDGCKCLNGGTCVLGNLGANCQCPAIYAGFYCDKPVCEAANPCMNGATCGISGDTWVCSCRPGYIGTTCETDINECESNPCVNGTCHDYLNGFYCACTPGFRGIICDEDIDECEGKPCLNGGSCTDLINAFICECVPGFTGSVCQTDIDECLSSPCENGGTCNDRVNAYTCDCSQGYYGEYCETGICQPSVADIVFVLDSSISMTETEFNKQLDFIIQFIDHIVIGDENLLVGIVTYSFQAKVEIHLGDYKDNVTLKEAVRNIKYRPGATFTDKGLNAAIDIFNKAPERPYNKTAKRYVYVMTDGMSNDRSKTKISAANLKASVNKMLAIGIGKQVSHQELLAIASDDTSRDRKYVYSVQNFDALFTILAELVALTCDECTWNQTSDIVYLLDSSSAMNIEDFKIGLNAITYITYKTKQMETTGGDVRTGLVTYGTEIELRRSLNSTTTKDLFLAEIQSIVLQDGHCPASNTDCDSNGLDKALAYVSENVFDSLQNDTREIVILFTNGRELDMNKIEAELDHLKAEDRTIFVVAVGDQADIETLQKIAGDPALVFSLNDDTIMSVLDALTTEFFFSTCDLSNDF